MTMTIERALVTLNAARRSLAEQEATIETIRRRIGDIDIALDTVRDVTTERSLTDDHFAENLLLERRRVAERDMEFWNEVRDQAQDELDQRMREKSAAVFALHAAQRNVWAAILDDLVAQLDWNVIDAIVVAAAHAQRPLPFKTDIHDIANADDITVALATRYKVLDFIKNKTSD